MPECLVRITSRPEGGAPETIRDKWIGIVLPVQGTSQGPLADVLTRQKIDRRGGYRILWDDAMEALGKKHPDAREWWEANVGRFPFLVFDPDCCEIVPD